MFLADASTKRPVAITCLLIALFGLGLNSVRKMSQESLPSFDVPYVVITTVWVGATPADIEKDVAKRIEDAVSSLDGLKHIDSQCQENFCLTIIEFQLNVNVDVAAVDVREKVDKILDDLPKDCERPVIEKYNPNSVSVVKLAITGDATINDKYDYADNILADKFAMLEGVARVDIIGGNKREVHIELDREKMVAANITTAEVIAAVKANINSMPAGRVRDSGTEISVKFDAEYPDVPDMNDFEVVSRNGIRRRIRDLGSVFMSSDEIRQEAYFQDKPCIELSVVKKGKGNTVDVVKLCRQQMQALQPTLPGGIHLEWISDEGATVEASVSAALSDIIGGILLCAAILLFFLANIQTTIIIAITMPLTIIISFFFMHMMGSTLNQATLLAMGLSVGILVSNSIVVLENVVLRMEDYKDRWEAARVGTSEVGVAIMASAGTNVVVMLPIGMMTSIVGRVFVSFATTTLIVNIVSILISFTLTPILCAIFLRSTKDRKQTRLARFAAWWTGKIMEQGQKYMDFLRWLTDRRILTALIVLGFVVLLVHACWLSKKLGFDFINPVDRAKLLIKLEYPINYDLDHTSQRVRALAAQLSKYSDLNNVLINVGRCDAFGAEETKAVYVGEIQLDFKEKTERKWSLFDRLLEIRGILAKEPGLVSTVAMPSELGGIATPVKLNIKGDDLDTLDKLGRQVKQITVNTPGAGNIDTSVREGKPQYLITPKRTIMKDVGVTSSVLGVLLRGNLEGVKTATYKSGDRSFDIRVKYAMVPGKDQVAKFMIPGGNGEPVLLSSLADVTLRTIPVCIYRRDKSRVSQVTGTLLPDAKLAQVLSGVYQTIRDQHVLPAGYTISTAGDVEYMKDAIADFAEALAVAAFLTYLTLAAILESFWRPWLILLTIPYGLIGVIWALLATGYGITILVMLGALMLIGVVVNAAVLIVDRFGQLRAQGVAPREAMLRGAGESYRAVLMVVLASALGMLPMAVGRGIGSELRAGIGAASFAGVLVAGILTIIALPLTYCLFTKKNK